MFSFENFSSTSTLFSSILAGFLASIISITMLSLLKYIQKRSKRKYDDIKHKVLLDLHRENIEKQILELEKRMANDKNRWKDTNHLLLSSIRDDNKSNLYTPENNHLNRFLISAGLKQEDFVIDKKMVFVLTPYNDVFYNIYLLIKDVCHSVGLKCSRGDEEYFVGDIFTQILKQILKASIIIANIEGRNPNVFYELGLAHALDKNTILITRSINELPIDIKSKRIILYKDDKELKDLLKGEFIKIFSDGDIKE
jgi:hypothetical protein